MYEAMGRRAPNSPHIAGAATTALMTVLAGYALANGFGERIVQVFEPPIVLTTITETREEQPPPAPFPINKDITLNMPDPIEIDDIFTVEPPPPTEKKKDVGEARIGPAVIDRAAPVRVLPKLRPATEKPPYPAASLRAEEEGVTGLEICVDARGRVTSASLKQSSGHVRLDEAALKWVRDARFTPGSVDGSPRAMCGHNVFYEWKLENGRT